MKRIDLEKRIQAQIDEISKSQLIKKCIEVAERAGKGGRTSKEWANAKYVFDDGKLRIDYERFGMGDIKFEVQFCGRAVLEVQERVDTDAKYPIVTSEGRRFEILRYNQGFESINQRDWEDVLGNWYEKVTKDAKPGEIEDAETRFGVHFLNEK